jgi:predicted DNA-binding transcriptional regulator AlpA
MTTSTMSAPTRADQLVHDTRTTAKLLGISIPVLKKWRLIGEGPVFVRLGPRRIGYLDADITRWLHRSRVAPKRARR